MLEINKNKLDHLGTLVDTFKKNLSEIVVVLSILDNTKLTKEENTEYNNLYKKMIDHIDSLFIKTEGAVPSNQQNT